MRTLLPFRLFNLSTPVKTLALAALILPVLALPGQAGGRDSGGIQDKKKVEDASAISAQDDRLDGDREIEGGRDSGGLNRRKINKDRKAASDHDDDEEEGGKDFGG